MKKFLKGTIFILVVLLGNIWLAGRMGVISTDVVPVWSRLFLCDEPIEYSLGNIDPRFGLTDNEVLTRIEESENVWEQNAGKNLFKHTPDGKLKIDFVFDERQERTIAQDKLNANLSKLEDNHEEILDDYNSLNKAYAERLANYNKSVVTYEKKLSNYNKDVSDWNKNPGTKEEYGELQDEQEELEDMREKLEKERKAVNDLAKKTNNLVSEEKSLVETYNSSLNSYINRYGGAKEFDQGLYISDGRQKSITIYQFRDAADLRLVLAHEMGHALGIGHLSEPASIMYYLMGEQNMDSLRLTGEDVEAVKDVCGIK